MQMLSTCLNLLQRTGGAGLWAGSNTTGHRVALGTGGGTNDEQILHCGLARKAKRLTVGCT